MPGEGSPGAFYERMGFAYTGAFDDGELVLRRPLGALAEAPTL